MGQTPVAQHLAVKLAGMEALSRVSMKISPSLSFVTARSGLLWLYNSRTLHSSLSFAVRRQSDWEGTII